MASFIETYLHKALPDITYADFKTFYGRRLDESQTLEYKSGELLVGYKGEYIRNGRLDKAKAHEGFIKLATSIAGLANAPGGLFILGVKEIQVKGNDGQISGKRPGAIYPIPDDLIQKESIEDNLRELIQFPKVAHVVKTQKPAQLRATCLLFRSYSFCLCPAVTV